MRTLVEEGFSILNRRRETSSLTNAASGYFPANSFEAVSWIIDAGATHSKEERAFSRRPHFESRITALLSRTICFMPESDRNRFVQIVHGKVCDVNCEVEDEEP